MLWRGFFPEKASEYDQQIPQSHTTDRPTTQNTGFHQTLERQLK